MVLILAAVLLAAVAIGIGLVIAVVVLLRTRLQPGRDALVRPTSQSGGGPVPCDPPPPSPCAGPSTPPPTPVFDPVCPYCNSHLKNRKLPKRRSSFKCPACGEQICVDLDQYVYPNMYLTETQAEYVGFLWQLDRWVWAKGSYADYLAMKAKLSAKFGGEAGIGDIIWGLMNESLGNCAEMEAERVQRYVRTMTNVGISAEEAREEAGESSWSIEQLEELMAEFREFDNRK